MSPYKGRRGNSALTNYLVFYVLPRLWDIKKIKFALRKLKSSWGEEPRQTDNLNIIMSKLVRYAESVVVLGNGY